MKGLLFEPLETQERNTNTKFGMLFVRITTVQASFNTFLIFVTFHQGKVSEKIIGLRRCNGFKL